MGGSSGMKIGYEHGARQASGDYASRPRGMSLHEHYATPHSFGDNTGPEASHQRKAKRFYNQHIMAEENAGRYLDPNNRDLIRYYAKEYKAPTREYLAPGEQRPVFTGRADSSSTYLGNDRSSLSGSRTPWVFSGGQDFTGNHNTYQPPRARRFSPVPLTYMPSRQMEQPSYNSYQSAPGPRSYMNDGPNSLDSFSPSSMQGLLSMAESLVSNSAQGMADGGEVRRKINARGFRKGGPMERMVSEMSDYSSGRR